jgi:uncharacterized membrane protein
LLSRLFTWDAALVLGSSDLSRKEKNTMCDRIVGARDALATDLKRAYSGSMFALNRSYLVGGVGLSVGLWVVANALVQNAGPLSVAALIVCAIVMLAMMVLFARLLRAPSRAGRQLLDKLEGFKLYLGFAEKERMAILHPPDMTPEIYERYLPYALALDVENKWSEQFADTLAKSGQRYQDYHPAWYGGRQWRSERGSIDFGRRMAAALPAAIDAAATPPGSSSGRSGGSSGGGRSGGGGGGGGGGGW